MNRIYFIDGTAILNKLLHFVYICRIHWVFEDYCFNQCEWAVLCLFLYMYLNREWWELAQVWVGQCLNLAHCTTILTFPSYNSTRKTQHITWSWIKPTGPTGVSGKSSIQPPWHWRNPNSSHRACMRIHASAELWRCVELPGAELGTVQGKTGWKSGGERDVG